MGGNGEYSRRSASIQQSRQFESQLLTSVTHSPRRIEGQLAGYGRIVAHPDITPVFG
jgi:hypothetical protein